MDCMNEVKQNKHRNLFILLGCVFQVQIINYESGAGTSKNEGIIKTFLSDAHLRK